MTLRRLGAGCAFALLAAWLPVSASAGSKDPQTKAFVYCSEASPESFNPQLSIANTTFDASSRNVYNRLVEFERGTTTLRPALAESWAISPDGLVYTFHLRHNVAFHTTPWFTPTRPFNADDVLYSFQRQWDPNHPDHALSGGTYEYFNSMDMPKLIKAIEKIDDYTVRFVLSQPEAPFLANLAMDFASILSAEYAAAMHAAGTPEKIDLQPVATGPFQFVSYQKDAIIRFKANPDYWQGKPAIDTLIFSITPDPAVAYAKLKAGECQLIPYPNPSDLSAMRRDPEIRVMSQEGLNVGYLAFNTQKPPFDDVRVRRALDLAINKDAIIAAVYQGEGRKAKNPIPPTMWSYNDAVKETAYDPEAARRLLAEAGHAGGFTTDIWALPVTRPYNPDGRRMAEMIQADWAEVGVRARIVSYEWGEFLKRTKAGEHQTMLFGWIGDNGDPDNFLYVLLSCVAAKDGTNRARWCNADFDDVVTRAKRTTDIAERSRLYQQAQVIFKQQIPWVTIAHSVVSTAMSTAVKNYKIDPLGGHIFNGVDLAD
ncbi:MAG: ABC transporter substrate-binding protein [Rhodospirillales bacterium]|nr:ABC transporter substrate-binding protein [Rhodospirillales bacterium]